MFFSYLNYCKILAYRQHRKGGDVTILLHPTLNTIELPLPDNFPASCDCVIVKILPLKLILVLLYRPPHCTREATVHLLSVLENICNDHDHVTIMRDFNAPRIDWTTCPPTPLDAVAYDIIEFCEAMNMTQLVPKPTTDDSILDIILTTKPNRFSNCAIEVLIASSDLNSIVCHLKCPTSVHLTAIQKLLKRLTTSHLITNLQLLIGLAVSRIHWKLTQCGINFNLIYLTRFLSALHKKYQELLRKAASSRTLFKEETPMEVLAKQKICTK